MTATGAHSSQRKNPESVSIVARAVWQASQTLHCMIISKSGHSALNAQRIARAQVQTHGNRFADTAGLGDLGLFAK